MNRVQHGQTKKKKVFADNSNAAFSRPQQDSAQTTSDAPSGSTHTTHSHHRHHHHHRDGKKNRNGEQVSTTTNAPLANENSVSSTNTSTTRHPRRESHFTCCICCEDAHMHSIFETCNHVDICHKCTLKLRVFNNDNRCSICKNPSDTVIFSRNANKSFADYNKDDLIYDETWKIYTDDYLLMNELTSLRRIECKLCKEQNGLVVSFENTQLLNHHMNEVHKLNYCSLCLKSRKVFLADQKLYTWNNLMKHLKLGEEDENGRIEGHPLCKFCNIRFYSDDEIFDHMYKQHERCFICQKHGVQFEFYKDYKHLERHFDEKHFLCPFQECREQGFKVFENELDLFAHKNKYHSSASSTKRGKIVLDISTLSNISHVPNDAERRQVRTGEINSSVIRFVDTGGDGYHNDSLHKKSAEASSYSDQKKKHHKGRKETGSGDVKEKNINLVKRMKEMVSESQYQELKFLSTQFLRGESLASEYYAKIVSILDENKKQALILAKNTYHSPEFNPNLNKEQPATAASKQQDKAPQENWPTLSNTPQTSSKPNWNPAQASNTQPKPKKEKQRPSPISHNIVRTPDLLWGVQGSGTPPAKLDKEQEFPSLGSSSSPPPSNKVKKSNSNWTKPLKTIDEDSEDKSKHEFSEFGNVKVYKFSDKKKKKNK
ncbi:hypothetical protein C9374_000183 [Naegleria lovaniensis]|uniref:RING-type domain-containing protein n=1 Tax=Naegleria lovaniensis TaxID=51637 RepID=A0AA88GZY0_NAELO|nr:uncharacterized protein C9374_000183 [Naegleria lovaniensis]KAG2388744.1 hypothetical protein C9374_000183 [Naegleria lovaniensis]